MSASPSPIIVWFRHNLRLRDNAALTYATQRKAPVINVFIYDKKNLRDYGGASKWWLKHSLSALHESLEKKSSSLFCFEGDTIEIFEKLVTLTKANRIVAQQQFEPDARLLEKKLEERIAGLECNLTLFNGYLLADPDRIKSKTGTPYKVFTPFWRECSQRLHVSTPIAVPQKIPSDPALEKTISKGVPFPAPCLNDDIGWSSKLEQYWQPGEQSARRQLKSFLSSAIFNYKDGRDIPAETLTSKLSPHLHFGEISANEVMFEVEKIHGNNESPDIKHYKNEIGWREFCHHLMWHWPNLAKQPFQPKFKKFPWRKKSSSAEKWEKGITGIPIVDAGMRELWETGWMHNRVRMIVASLLVKNLLHEWKIGERWFWDTLVDANLANNIGGWQWVAGCGADAAPYFRIFNPVTQAEKFDKNADYIKRWVPELSKLPAKMALAPWQFSNAELAYYQFTLGEDYPEPIVDLKLSRQEALAALEACNQQHNKSV